ncbi:P-loop containing nucleoside triphosphate hydrolase protein [Gilbertella persicaria]|uniref:P-loop containing nucleoside triphosphate hydrolase protein n=1 Tax=Gilbertella persicaria TaxID=101096 RepID=UPI00222028B4|nr:P-loop containing nucleoside triphosphate hydrolase protein [Gilbertella persicaria]KAI8082490.1 P-loop containing nucleoside triphosphate hydrolase protein [Gilbertella persicaria]
MLLNSLILLRPKNIIAQSRNGTGKTAAFTLAMLQRVNQNEPYPQGLCVLPTRELARQMYNTVTQMAQFTKVQTVLVVKDSKAKYQHMSQHIIIGTPGSLLDSIRRSYIDTGHLKTLVLDEADQMLEEQGLGDQSFRIKNAITSRSVQTMLFSATFPDHVQKFALRFAPNASRILLKREELSVERITQFYMDCNSEEHKYEVLCALYDVLTVSQSIIFCKTRDTAEKIASKMTDEGHAVKNLHGGMSSVERDQLIDDFSRGEFKVLISTNVVSRGIDIPQVSLVINYDLPTDHKGDPDPEVYLHRIGRTGRFGRKGVSVAFVHDHRSWIEMNFIERYFGSDIIKVPTDDWQETERVLKSLIK